MNRLHLEYDKSNVYESILVEISSFGLKPKSQVYLRFESEGCVTVIVTTNFALEKTKEMIDSYLQKTMERRKSREKELEELQETFDYLLKIPEDYNVMLDLSGVVLDWLLEDEPCEDTECQIIIDQIWAIIFEKNLNVTYGYDSLLEGLDETDND